MSKTTQHKNHSSPLLILALDFGGSATKGIYCAFEQNNPSSLVMEPEVLKVSLESITSHTQSLGTTETREHHMGELYG